MWALPSSYLKIITILVPKLPFCLVAMATSLSHQNGQFCLIFVKLWIKPKLHVASVNITHMIMKLGYCVILWYKIMIMALIALRTVDQQFVIDHIKGR